MNGEISSRPWRHRVGRVALSGMLAASLGTGLATPLAALADTTAQAVSYGTATFTIDSKDNTGAAYDVYALFYADMNGRGYENASVAGAAEDTFDTSEYPVVEWPGIATKIIWSSDAMKAAVLSFLDANGYKAWIEASFACVEGSTETGALFSFEHALPQNAAEFTAEMIGASANDADAATVPPTKAERTFALNLARAISAAGISPEATAPDASGNASFTGTEGYYLFVTNDASVGASDAGDEAATSPIWVPLGGSTGEIVEKTAVPTLDKQVVEDSTGAYGYVADANRGQDLEYRLVATMPQNIKAFNEYFMAFTDTLPDGLQLAGGDTSSVKVVLHYAHGGNEYAPDITKNSNVSIAYEGNVLRVNLTDLKKIHANVDLNATVEVTYRAHLTDDAVIGVEGNRNSAVLSYSSNPVTYYDPTDTEAPGYNPSRDPNSPSYNPYEDPTGTTTTLEGAHKTRTATWRIELNKVDKQTHANLAGARFTVQVAVPKDANGTAAAYSRDAGAYIFPNGSTATCDVTSIGKYVQADGALGADAHEFVTDSDGMIVVPRIDSGTYVIHETAAPNGYELQDADIEVVIAPTYDQASGAISDWTLSISGGEAVTTSDTDVITNLIDNGDGKAVAAALAEGRISIQTSDDKKIIMPITGMDGTTAAIAIAGGVLLVSMTGLYISRRHMRKAQE